MQKYSDVVLQAPLSTPIVGASVQVNIFGGGAATIYADNGVTVEANPTLTDANGRFSFYAADGRYTLVVSKSGFTTQTITDILLADPAQESADTLLFIPAGTGAVARPVQEDLRDRILATQYMTAAQKADVYAGTLTLDVTAAILAASVQAVLTGRGVEFPRGKYRQDSVFALTSAHNNLKWYGCGDNGATIYKHFNGTGMTVTGCNGFEMHNMHYYGDQANFTGKGIVFSGTCNYPRFPGTVLEGFQSTFLEFGANSGYDFSALGGKAYLDRTNAQSLLTTVAMAANDTGAAHRHFEDFGNDGSFDLSGAQATIVSGSRFDALVTSANTSVLAITGCSWAATVAITVNSVNTTIVGNRIANSITLAAGSTGTFVGNHPTSGTFTNNATAGAWVVLHHQGGALVYLLGQHKLDIQSTVAEAIQTARGNFPGDADTTFTVGGSGNRIFYQVPLTANRTVTLSTTGAFDGCTVRVSRQAAATGASTVTVGSKALAVSQWVEHVFDGSAWQLSAFGSL